MAVARTPPPSRHHYQEKPGTARSTTMAPPARTRRPPAPPPRQRRTRVVVEEGSGSTIHHTAGLKACAQKAPGPAISRPPWPRRSRANDTNYSRRQRQHGSRSRLSCAPPRRPPSSSSSNAAAAELLTPVAAAAAPAQQRSQPLHPQTRAPAARAPYPAGAPPDLGPKPPADARGSRTDEVSPGSRGGHARPEQSERGGEPRRRLPREPRAWIFTRQALDARLFMNGAALKMRIRGDAFVRLQSFSPVR
jgi:hypothetical protein